MSSESPVSSSISSLSLGHVLLAGYGCDEDGPYLVVDDVSTSPWRRSRVFVRGRSFTLSGCAERHCTGRHDLETGRGMPCPEGADVYGPDREQCFPCFTATGFNPAFYNAPSVSPQQRRRNQTPHVVYLASFGPGALKVGMAHAPRRLSRLLEQGARLGAVIASFPTADAARELEALIVTRFGVAESVRAARKRQLLGVPLPAERARRELLDQVGQIAAVRPEVQPSPEVLELDGYYFGAERWGGSFTDLTDTAPPSISGRCLGMIGDVLVATQGEQRFLLSIGGCVAHRVQIDAALRENRFVGQLGLPF